VTTFKDKMSGTEFRAVVRKLRFADASGRANDEGQSAAARFLGLSPRTVRLYAEEGPPQSIAHYLRTLEYDVAGNKQRRYRLLKQIEAMEKNRIYHKGPDTGGRMVDETESWRATLQDWLSDIEFLLRQHPSGLPPQIE
jgi:hypothetical protein